MIYLILILIINMNINVKTSEVDSPIDMVENGYRNCEFGTFPSALTGISILSLSEEEAPQPVKPTVTLANKPPPPSTPVTGNYH